MVSCLQLALRREVPIKQKLEMSTTTCREQSNPRIIPRIINLRCSCPTAQWRIRTFHDFMLLYLKRWNSRFLYSPSRCFQTFYQFFYLPNFHISIGTCLPVSHIFHLDDWTQRLEYPTQVKTAKDVVHFRRSCWRKRTPNGRHKSLLPRRLKLLNFRR